MFKNDSENRKSKNHAPAELIKAAMEKKSLTPHQLARNLKLPVRLIVKALQGEIPPALAVLLEEKLAIPYDHLVPSCPPRSGFRLNQGKPRYDLVSPFAIEELAWVYTKGAEKYPERNWEKGLPLMDCFASLMRHAWAWAQGHDLDPETGLHHMAHAMWNAAAIVHFWKLDRTGLDNRPGPLKPTK